MLYDFPISKWQNFLYISSAETSRHFLYSLYKKDNRKDAQKDSYENSYSLIHYIEQGISFFTQAKQSPLNIKPILLFYGFVFLIKGCLLTVDPKYPESSSVLAHGVSTRKRKKQNYQYLLDEVKLQKNGLFPHFSDKMFHMKHLEGTKIKIECLLKEIPELSSFFKKWEGTNYMIPLKKEKNVFYISDDILDFYKMTVQRLNEYLNTKSNRPLTIQKKVASQLEIKVKGCEQNIEVLPFRFNLTDGNYYFLKNAKELSFFPELMIHYLLLYHLSMIARYEIEWWAELIHQKPSLEYPLIVQYLNLCLSKIPYLIDQYLFMGNDDLL